MAELTGPNTYELTVAEYERLKTAEAAACQMREALEIARQFIGDEQCCRARSFMPDPTQDEEKSLNEATAALTAVCRALASTAPCPHQPLACALTAALELVYAKWEDGTPCYEDADPSGYSLGNALQLSEEEETQILRALELAGVETILRLKEGPKVAAPICPHKAEVERLRKLCGETEEAIASAAMYMPTILDTKMSLLTGKLRAEAEKGGKE